MGNLVWGPCLSDFLHLQPGSNVNAQACNGESVLMEAAGSGNPDCVELLLRHGANPDLAGVTGHLPIHRAAYEGHYLSVFSLAPDKPVNVQLLTSSGATFAL